MPFYTVLRCIMQPAGQPLTQSRSGEFAATQLFRPEFYPVRKIHASSDREALAMAKLYVAAPVLAVIKSVGGIQ